MRVQATTSPEERSGRCTPSNRTSRWPAARSNRRRRPAARAAGGGGGLGGQEPFRCNGFREGPSKSEPWGAGGREYKENLKPAAAGVIAMWSIHGPRPVSGLASSLLCAARAQCWRCVSIACQAVKPACLEATAAVLRSPWSQAKPLEPAPASWVPSVRAGAGSLCAGQQVGPERFGAAGAWTGRFTSEMFRTRKLRA